MKDALIYSRTIRFNKVNNKGEVKQQTYTKWLVKYANKTFECKFSNKAKAYMELSGLKSPLNVNIDLSNYFVSKEEYIQDGIKHTKPVIVFTEFYEGSLTQGHFEERTLDDLINE